jgi:hypothetical protein
MNKKITLFNAMALALLVNLSTPTIASAAFSFGLWGDMPYARNNDGTKAGEKMMRLVDNMNAANLAFTVFDGDTKDGSSLCTDSALGQESIDLFNKVKAPTIYVPGDNEWTDCHRINNGGYNNLERLSYLRQTMFVDDYSFGQTKMKLTHPKNYRENSRWIHGGMVFVSLNVPGSNNNNVHPGECISDKSARTQADCDADTAEYLARNAANIAFLQNSFKIAKNRNAAGVMVVIQADPGFDLPETETINERDLPNFDGYTQFLTALSTETNAFVGQVVLVHGDTHFYKVDKPLMDQAHLIKNFTRVETFGSPNLHWIKVSVDTKNPNVFSFHPMIVPGN